MLEKIIERTLAHFGWEHEPGEDAFLEYSPPKDWIPATPMEQLARLRQYFPKLPDLTGQQTGLVRRPLSSGGTHWVVVPNWRRINYRYGSALTTALHALKDEREGHFISTIDDMRLMPHPSNHQMIDEIARAQVFHEVLVFPTQLGDDPVLTGAPVKFLRRPPSYEFALDVFSVACILLGDPERLRGPTDLGIDCPGNIIRTGRWSKPRLRPHFSVVGDRLRLDAHRDDRPYETCGPATGFVPRPDM